jgi:hypothetical protein
MQRRFTACLANPEVRRFIATLSPSFVRTVGGYKFLTVSSTAQVDKLRLMPARDAKMDPGGSPSGRIAPKPIL